MNDYKVMIGRDDTFWDITKIIQKVTWSGRRTAAPRILELQLSDSEQLTQRAPADCGEGQTVVFTEGGKERFRGLLMKEGRRGQSRQLTLKCFDNCIRLCNNMDSFSFRQKRADEIFTECCGRLGLATGTVANTGHVIGELVKAASSHWDVIEDALSQTYKATGDRFYVYADEGKISLIKRIEQDTMPILELKTNLSDYQHARSIEDTRTRLKLVTSKGDTKSSTVVKELEAKIGQFQTVESIDAGITDTEVNQRIEVFQTEQGIINETMKVWGTGDSDVKAGGCVFVYIPEIDANRIMFVEEDTHTWSLGGHTMTATLEYAKKASVETQIYQLPKETTETTAAQADTGTSSGTENGGSTQEGGSATSENTGESSSTEGGDTDSSETSGSSSSSEGGSSGSGDEGAEPEEGGGTSEEGGGE